MEIKNSTPWSTEDLRAMFRRCTKEVEKVEKPVKKFHQRNKHFKLDILNMSRSGARGRATVGGYWIMLKIGKDWSLKTEIPTKPDEVDTVQGVNIYHSIRGASASIKIPIGSTDGIDKYPFYWNVVGTLDEMSLENRKSLARLMIHEYHHTIGYGHVIDARRYANDPSDKFNVDWVVDYPIRRKEQPVKVVKDIREVRYVQAIQNLKVATTRAKRAETIKKKWQSKVKYYEKVAASKKV